MSKYPIFLQDNENSCGAYCLKMLLNYYKRDDEIKNIKKRCRLCKEGISVYGLIQVLKQYHIEAKLINVILNILKRFKFLPLFI